MAANDGRYAPSPTGELHLGNLRTAVLAWLFARSAGARLLLRIEDLDRERVVDGMAQRQLDDLRAIGLEWDGEPLVQSARLAYYRRALAQLSEADLVYPCFCSRAEVREAASAPHGALPEGAYPGTCSTLSVRGARQRVERGDPHCLRARAGGQSIAFTDRMLGRVESAVDDFVVRRRDGVPAYNLAAMVDDAAQQVGEIVRGDDLAEGTVRQLWLARALGLRAPAYAHVPLVLDEQGRRLSKRAGDVTLADWRQRGLEPRDVRAWIAHSLGLAEAGEHPSMHDLLHRFDPTRVPRDAIVFRGVDGLPAAAAST